MPEFKRLKQSKGISDKFDFSGDNGTGISGYKHGKMFRQVSVEANKVTKCSDKDSRNSKDSQVHTSKGSGISEPLFDLSISSEKRVSLNIFSMLEYKTPCRTSPDKHSGVLTFDGFAGDSLSSVLDVPKVTPNSIYRKQISESKPHTNVDVSLPPLNLFDDTGNGLLARTCPSESSTHDSIFLCSQLDENCLLPSQAPIQNVTGYRFCNKWAPAKKKPVVSIPKLTRVPSDILLIHPTPDILETSRDLFFEGALVLPQPVLSETPTAQTKACKEAPTLNSESPTAQTKACKEAPTLNSEIPTAQTKACKKAPTLNSESPTAQTKACKEVPIAIHHIAPNSWSSKNSSVCFHQTESSYMSANDTSKCEEMRINSSEGKLLDKLINEQPSFMITSRIDETVTPPKLYLPEMTNSIVQKENCHESLSGSVNLKCTLYMVYDHAYCKRTTFFKTVLSSAASLKFITETEKVACSTQTDTCLNISSLSSKTDPHNSKSPCSEKDSKEMKGNNDLVFENSVTTLPSQDDIAYMNEDEEVNVCPSKKRAIIWPDEKMFFVKLPNLSQKSVANENNNFVNENLEDNLGTEINPLRTNLDDISSKDIVLRIRNNKPTKPDSPNGKFVPFFTSQKNKLQSDKGSGSVNEQISQTELTINVSSVITPHKYSHFSDGPKLETSSAKRSPFLIVEQKVPQEQHYDPDIDNPAQETLKEADSPAISPNGNLNQKNMDSSSELFQDPCRTKKLVNLLIPDGALILSPRNTGNHRHAKSYGNAESIEPTHHNITIKSLSQPAGKAVKRSYSLSLSQPILWRIVVSWKHLEWCGRF